MPQEMGEPVYVGRNRWDDLVVMSREKYQALLETAAADRAIGEAEAELVEDDALEDIDEALSALREKHFEPYQVRMTPRAVRDLDRVYASLARHLQQPGPTRRAVEELERQLRSLGQLPYRSVPCATGLYGDRGYRQFFLTGCTVICRISEEKRLVGVVTILLPEEPEELRWGLRKTIAYRRTARYNSRRMFPGWEEGEPLRWRPFLFLYRRKGAQNMGKFKESVGKFAKSAKERTGDTVEITKLRGKINGEKNNISELTRQLGALCLEKYDAGQPLDEELTALCGQIGESRKLIEDYQGQITAIKAAREEAGEGPLEDLADDIEDAVQDAVEDVKEAVGEMKAAVAGGLTCSGCGVPLADDVNFCPACGKRLK